MKTAFEEQKVLALIRGCSSLFEVAPLADSAAYGALFGHELTCNQLSANQFE